LIPASLFDAPSLEDLKKILVPVLVFQSEENCKGHPDATKQLINVLPNLEVFSIKGACHDPWYSHSEVFFRKCIAFLNKRK
jgi:hypothetical protein